MRVDSGPIMINTAWFSEGVRLLFPVSSRHAGAVEIIFTKNLHTFSNEYLFFHSAKFYVVWAIQLSYF